jgi:hypothetical protein
MDEDQGTTYQVIQAPERGLLRATSALPGLWISSQVSCTVPYRTVLY